MKYPKGGFGIHMKCGPTIRVIVSTGTRGYFMDNYGR
jgi:hypothetical protein